MVNINRQNTLTPQYIKNFIKNIEPLDMIIFKGNDGFSNLINNLETSGIALHVEIMITKLQCRNIKIPDEDYRPLSWGSTMSFLDTVPSIETGENIMGVQIRDLEALIMNYIKADGNVGYCKLQSNPLNQRAGETLSSWFRRQNEIRTQLEKAYTTYNGRIYNDNPIALLGAMFPVLRSLQEDNDNKWLFCSEFVTMLYTELGIINDQSKHLDVIWSREEKI